MVEPFELEDRGDIVVVSTTDDVDMGSADLLRDRCLAAMTNHSIGLILDLSGSEYLDSAGVRAIFTIAEQLEPHRQRVALVVPSDAHVRRVLEIVDIESSASVHGSESSAVQRLRSRSPAEPRGGET